MKLHPKIRRAPAGILAATLMAAGAGMTAQAATAPALQGQIVLRPLTPGDVSTYKLATGTEVSGGLTTVGIGTPVYLEAEINIAVPASNIVSVTWSLTNTPVGSKAALQPSPLGTNVPIYEPADRLVYQVAGRSYFRTDLVGQYTVLATIVTSSSGSTNVSKTITAGTYMGVQTCALCHSGGQIAPDKVQPWETTAHSMIFTKGIDGNLGLGAFYSKSCLACHTVGYDTNTNAVNGGFDDVMAQLNWQFPTNIVAGNWANLQTNYPALANLANIQCENCHGPGSQHAYSLGNTNFITKTLNSGDCNQCHDAPTHHIKGTEWYVSAHAGGLSTAVRIPTGPSRPQCVGCHTAAGFIGRLNSTTVTNTDYSAIDCQACHEPHGQTTPANNPHLIRMLSAVTMPDGTVVSNAGEGALCLQCHQVRNGPVTVQLTNYPVGLPTWYGGSSFGVHDGPQGDMIEGINAVTYGQIIPSSPHKDVVTNLCVGCHMQTDNTTDPTFLQAGGHTFKVSATLVGTNGVTNTVDKVAVCVQCHGNISTFNFQVADYDGNGVIEGVQTEVQNLLNKLSTLLPNSTYVSNGNYMADGLVKSPSVKTNWPAKFLKAAYNWQFVNNDGSLGVHNAAFAVGLLKASIADLTGVSVAGGLPDWWAIQYFGSITNANAAPNATPAGDGIPNWLKYALGVNPTVSGIVLSNGVVWANGTSLVNPVGTTNAIRIYTAAEVAFNTVAGKTYQLQAISSLGGGWQNVGAPLTGTGASMSYVTPTRANAQQYYRVVQSP